MTHRDWRHEHEANQRRAEEQTRAAQRLIASFRQRESRMDRHFHPIMAGALLLGMLLPVGIALLLVVISLLLAGMARP